MVVVAVVVIREESGGRPQIAGSMAGGGGEGYYRKSTHTKSRFPDSHFNLVGVTCEEGARYLLFKYEADGGRSLVHRGKRS